MGLETITEWFGRPAGQRFAEKVEHDHSIALLEERKAWSDQIRSADEKFQRVLPGLLKNEAKLQQEREDLIKRHREERKQLDRRFDAARNERAQASAERDRVVEPAERSLRFTASPKIDEFSRALDQRRRELGSGDREWGNSYDGRQIIVASTYPSIQRAALNYRDPARGSEAPIGTAAR